MIKNDKQIWKYSLSNYNKSSNSAYYYCSDTSFKGKGTCSFNDEKNQNLKKNLEIKKLFN